MDIPNELKQAANSIDILSTNTLGQEIETIIVSALNKDNATIKQLEINTIRARAVILRAIGDKALRLAAECLQDDPTNSERYIEQFARLNELAEKQISLAVDKQYMLDTALFDSTKFRH